MKTKRDLNLEAAIATQPTDEKKLIAYLKFVLAESVEMYGKLMNDYMELSMKYQKEHLNG